MCLKYTFNCGYFIEEKMLLLAFVKINTKYKNLIDLSATEAF